MPVVCLLNIILCLLRRKCYTCICKISGSKCQKAVDLYTLNVYIMIIEEAFMKQRELIKKLEAAGFEFSRHGGNHDVYVRGSDIEQIPRHKEINEMLAKAILRKWGL